MKNALLFAAYGTVAILIGALAGYDLGQKNPPAPPVCTAICTPYTEAAARAEDAANRCDKALLTCLSWQVVVKQEVSELQIAFVNFKNAITGCAQ